MHVLLENTPPIGRNTLCVMCSRRPRLRARDASSTASVSRSRITHSQQMWPTRTSTWTRTKNVTWTHRLSGWNSRPHWGIRPLYFGDCENKGVAERLEEQNFDRCDAAPHFFTSMISMALDRDPRWTWSKPTSHRKIRFPIWTVYEVGMTCEHLKRERVLHCDRTEITPNPKILESWRRKCTPLFLRQIFLALSFFFF